MGGLSFLVTVYSHIHAGRFHARMNVRVNCNKICRAKKQCPF